MPDESKMADEFGMADGFGMADEFGGADEIGVSDEIGFGLLDGGSVPDTDDMTDEMGLDEIGLPDMDLSALLGDPGSEPEPGEFAAGADGAMGAGIASGLGDADPDAPADGGKRKKEFFLKRIFHKFFDNVPVEGGREEELMPEDLEKQAEEKKAEKEKKKEEQKAAKEAAKKEKEAAKKEKEAAKRAKAEEKKTEKENKKKEDALKEMKEVAVETDTGRVNRVGAVIVFAFFVILATMILIGANTSFYELSVQGAEREFSLQHYNEAYHKIQGLEVKPADMELHDKIMTVMFVNKQLNSYNNFYAMGDYPKALDSLVKGLERYDKYLALARELGIESDLDYVRDQLLAELERVYGLSEREAVSLTKMEDLTEYSARVYEVAGTVVEEDNPLDRVEYVP